MRRNIGQSVRRGGHLLRAMSVASAAWLGLNMASPAGAACTPVPAQLDAGRFMISFMTVGGESLRLLSDTGGGGTIVGADAARRAGLVTPPAPADLVAQIGPETRLADVPAVRPGVPPPPGPVLVSAYPGPAPGWPERIDGVVGESWFAGRRWTFDYAAGTLALDCEGQGASLAVGLLPAEASPRRRQFPRVEIVVAGEPIAVLFDTGASTWLTPPALEALGDGGPAVRATSMISADRFERWRSQHPDWRVIADAQVRTGARMIEARDVSIAGIAVGSVWFTERPRGTFEGMMSSLMSGPVEGALGGNALGGLRITIDYPNRTGWIARAGPVDRSRP